MKMIQLVLLIVVFASMADAQLWGNNAGQFGASAIPAGTNSAFNPSGTMFGGQMQAQPFGGFGSATTNTFGSFPNSGFGANANSQGGFGGFNGQPGNNQWGNAFNNNNKPFGGFGQQGGQQAGQQPPPPPPPQGGQQGGIGMGGTAGTGSNPFGGFPNNNMFGGTNTGNQFTPPVATGANGNFGFGGNTNGVAQPFTPLNNNGGLGGFFSTMQGGKK